MGGEVQPRLRSGKRSALSNLQGQPSGFGCPLIGEATSRMDAVLRLQEIFNEEADTSVRSRLYAEGFIIRENGGSTYAINFKRHILINLTEEASTSTV